jgi:hypothetical protein
VLATTKIRPITNEDHLIYRRGGTITKDREWCMREGEGVGEAHGEGRELTHVKNRKVNTWENKLGIKRMFKC